MGGCYTDYYVAQIDLLSIQIDSQNVKNFIGNFNFHSELLPTALFSVGMSGDDGLKVHSSYTT